MRRELVVGFAISVGILACVGDSPNQTPAPDGGTAGEEGGPCYGDGTCNKTKPWLACLSKLCVAVGDGGADATADAPSGDAGDGGSLTCPAEVQSIAQTVRCAGAGPCSQYCCLLTSAYFCNASDCPGNRIECDDLLDCAGKRCCLNATIAALACPVNLSAVTTSVCSNSCTSSQIEMCGLGDSCAKGTCVKTKIWGNEYGICL